MCPHSYATHRPTDAGHSNLEGIGEEELADASRDTRNPSSASERDDENESFRRLGAALSADGSVIISDEDSTRSERGDRLSVIEISDTTQTFRPSLASRQMSRQETEEYDTITGISINASDRSVVSVEDAGGR